MRAYLEITNICNRRCPFCPGTDRKKQFVPAEVIRSRLGKLKDAGVDELYLHVLGEPLLHPDFAKIAALCQENAIPVNLTTNGTLLTREKQEILLSCPVFRQINFSLQALEADETDILDSILDFCLKALERRPELYLNLRLWDFGRDFSSNARNARFFSRIREKTGLDLPQEPHFSSDRRSVHLAGRLYLHGGSMFDWPVKTAGRIPPEPGADRAFCYGLISQFGVLADGSVVPCCLDSEGAMTLGNMDATPLREILASPRAAAIRKGFRNGIAAEPFCRTCTYRERHSAARVRKN